MNRDAYEKTCQHSISIAFVLAALLGQAAYVAQLQCVRYGVGEYTTQSPGCNVGQ